MKDLLPATPVHDLFQAASVKIKRLPPKTMLTKWANAITVFSASIRVSGVLSKRTGTDVSQGILMQNVTNDDEKWMKMAIKAAEAAAAQGEVPVGAVLVKDDTLLAAAGNKPISLNDPTAHAEIRALRLASEQLANYRLTGTTLYVTLEPCIMCIGAIIHARVERLVYGASDSKTGAVHSLYSIGDDDRLNHKLNITNGVMQQECSALLKDFFRQKRKTR